jgi:hypothetical protein
VYLINLFSVMEERVFHKKHGLKLMPFITALLLDKILKESGTCRSPENLCKDNAHAHMQAISDTVAPVGTGKSGQVSRQEIPHP